MLLLLLLSNFIYYYQILRMIFFQGNNENFVSIIVLEISGYHDWLISDPIVEDFWIRKRTLCVGDIRRPSQKLLSRKGMEIYQFVLASSTSDASGRKEGRFDPWLWKKEGKKDDSCNWRVSDSPLIPKQNRLLYKFDACLFDKESADFKSCWHRYIVKPEPWQNIRGKRKRKRDRIVKSISLHFSQRNRWLDTPVNGGNDPNWKKRSSFYSHIVEFTAGISSIGDTVDHSKLQRLSLNLYV